MLWFEIFTRLEPEAFRDALISYLSMEKDACYYFGKIKKTHGYKGDCIIECNEPVLRNWKEEELVFIEIDDILVPFFIDEYAEKSSNQIIVHFDDLDSDEKIREFLNHEVYVEKKFVKKIKDSGRIVSNDFIGYKVFDANKKYMGEVSEFINIPGNPLLNISQNEREILIPVNENTIIRSNDKKKAVYINIPDDLLNLNE